MDQRDHRLQCLSICNRLYNFFMKNLSLHAFKTLTLGQYKHPDSRPIYETDQKVHPSLLTQEETPWEEEAKSSNPFATSGSSSHGHEQDHQELPEDQNDANINQETSNVSSSAGRSPEEEAPTQLPSFASEAKPPKKVVSINDRTEEIDTRKKKIKRKSSTQKLASFEQEEEEPKPLKSILKGGSNLGEKSNPFVDRTSDG